MRTCEPFGFGVSICCICKDSLGLIMRAASMSELLLEHINNYLITLLVYMNMCCIIFSQLRVIPIHTCLRPTYEGQYISVYKAYKTILCQFIDSTKYFR